MQTLLRSGLLLRLLSRGVHVRPCVHEVSTCYLRGFGVPAVPCPRTKLIVGCGLRSMTSDRSSRGGVGPDHSSRAASDDDEESDSDLDSDSDDDEEVDSGLPYGKRGRSQLWLTKMRTYHRVMDVNKDGTVSWDDFRLMADKFVQLGHLSDTQQQLFNHQLRYVWENNWGASDDPYCFVTEEALIRSMEHAVNTPDLCRKMHKFLPFLFKAVDYNCSKDISIEEHKLLFKCLGLSEDAAVVSFNSIDLDKSGLITLDEFVAHGRQFFISEDESNTSKFFWGPLAK